MRGSTAPTRLLAVLAATLATTAYAQSGGYAGFGRPGNDPDYGYGDGDDAGSDASRYSYDGPARARAVHGILASVAFVILFPMGAILLRLVPGRWSFHLHWVVQMLAWVLYIAAAALGLVLIGRIRFPGEDWDFISNPTTGYHPIIGIIVFILLLVQPSLGLLHHRNFKAVQKRTLPSYLHLWNGRVAILLGIVNGGLGLQVAGARDTAKLAYTIVAAIFGGTWVVLALLSEFRGRRRDMLDARVTKDSEKAAKLERIHRAGVRRASSDGSSRA